MSPDIHGHTAFCPSLCRFLFKVTPRKNVTTWYEGNFTEVPNSFTIQMGPCKYIENRLKKIIIDSVL